MSVVRRITLPRSATSRADRIRPARPATHSVRRLPQSERTAPSPPPTVCPHPALRRTWPVWKVSVKTISARRALVMLTPLIVCTGFWIICAGFWRHITAPPERVSAPHSGGVRPLIPLPPWDRAFVQIPSPNWDLRPPGTRVSALVLHLDQTGPHQPVHGSRYCLRRSPCAAHELALGQPVPLLAPRRVRAVLPPQRLAHNNQQQAQLRIPKRRHYPVQQIIGYWRRA